MYKLAVKLCYDGTDFWGWQKQPQNEATIQNQVEQTLKRLTDEDISLVGSGRTDRGVHALSQWAHFKIQKDPEKIQLKKRLAKHLTLGIGLRDIYIVPEEFHAQRSVQKKTYVYRISQKKFYDPFKHRFSLHYPWPLNFDNLLKSLSFLEGEHDFSSFQSTGTQLKSTVRTIYKIRCLKRDENIIISITGSGFLKQMIRNIVGTALDMQQKGAHPDHMLSILNANDRATASNPAPPQGLILSRVVYPQTLDNKCRKL